MIWQGKHHNRWRRRFAIFPVEVGGIPEQPEWCWFDWYEWRYTEIFSVYFERRRPGATDTFLTQITCD